MQVANPGDTSINTSVQETQANEENFSDDGEEGLMDFYAGLLDDDNKGV